MEEYVYLGIVVDFHDRYHPDEARIQLYSCSPKESQQTGRQVYLPKAPLEAVGVDREWQWIQITIPFDIRLGMDAMEIPMILFKLGLPN